MKFLRFVVFLSACSLGDVIDGPKAPINGICAPGASYVCPCGDETWDSAWKSGKQYCGPGFHVTPCECPDAGDDAD